MSSAAQIQFLQARVTNDVVEATRLLRDASLEIDPSDRGNAAIMWASATGNAVLVQLLLADARVNPDECDCTMKTPMCRAVSNGHALVVALLLADPRVDPTRDNPLSYACRFGHTRIVELLLADARTDPSALENKAIRAAASHGHARIVELLMRDSRVDASAKHSAAILSACMCRHTDVVALLLTGARVHTYVAVQCATRHGYDDIVALLLRDARVFDFSDERVLIEPCGNGHARVVEMLLADTARPDACRVQPSQYMNEAFRRACDAGHSEIVEMLCADRRFEWDSFAAHVLNKSSTIPFTPALLTALSRHAEPRPHVVCRVATQRLAVLDALDALVRRSRRRRGGGGVCRDVVHAYVCAFATGVPYDVYASRASRRGV
jgi:ankyrin repeat protein